jgi:hypothetical protein
VVGGAFEAVETADHLDGDGADEVRISVGVRGGGGLGGGSRVGGGCGAWGEGSATEPGTRKPAVRSTMPGCPATASRATAAPDVAVKVPAAVVPTPVESSEAPMKSSCSHTFRTLSIPSKGRVENADPTL